MRSTNDLGIPLDTLRKKVLEQGDTVAYDDLMTELIDYNIDERIKWSKTMAVKHDFNRAYEDYIGWLSMKCGSRDFSSCLTKNERDTVILFLKRLKAKGPLWTDEYDKQFNLD
jgi:hypothetical protein